MYPEKSLANEATLSAMPSMTPNCAGPAPIDARNAGRTQYAISLAVSFRNEVAPKAIRLWEPRSEGSADTSIMEILYHSEPDAGAGILVRSGPKMKLAEVQYMASYLVTSQAPPWFSSVTENSSL